MKNYDDIKLVKDNHLLDETENQNENDAEIVVSLIEPKLVGNNKKKNKNKFFTVLLSSLKADNFKPLEREIRGDKAMIPVLKFTIISVFLTAILGVFMFCFRSFVSLKLLIPMILVYASLSIPIITLVFFVEFNTRKTIRTLNVVSMVVLGLLSCLLLQTFCYEVLIRFIQRTYLDAFIMPLIWTILLYFLLSIYCNVLKIEKMSECFLIAISFSAGYTFAKSLLSGFENLFVVTELNVIGHGSNYYLPVIINEAEDLAKSLDKMLSNWYLDFLFVPTLFACMSTMLGAVVSSREQSKKNKLPLQISMFLLIPLCIMLYAFSVIQTNFVSFNVIVKLLSLLASIFISLKLIDKSLELEFKDVS